MIADWVGSPHGSATPVSDGSPPAMYGEAYEMSCLVGQTFGAGVFVSESVPSESVCMQELR